MIDNQTIKDRIALYIRAKGLNRSRFEKEAGLSNGYLNSIKGSVGSEKLENILNAFPDLSGDWLVYGRGDMLKTAAPQVEETAGMVSMPREVFDQITKLTSAVSEQQKERNEFLTLLKSQQTSIESLTRSVETLSKKGEGVDVYGHAAPQAAQG